MMKLYRAMWSAVALTVAVAASPVSAQVAQADLKSQKANGLVVLQPDPVLSEGRLVLRVVGFNQTSAPVTLKASDVTITTASGAPVSITPLAQLVADLTGVPTGSTVVQGVQGAYSGPSGLMNQVGTGGQVAITNFTGGSTVSQSVTTPAPAKTLTPAQKKAQDQQVAALQTAILDSTVIAPKAAAGGQVVTEKLKFKGADKRGLKVTVSFAGEQHEFTFTAPPAK